MGWIGALDALHDKIDPLDAWVQKQVLGNQEQQEQFIGTWGPVIGAAFTGGATLAGAGAAGAAGAGAGAAGAGAAGAGAAGAGLGAGTAGLGAAGMGAGAMAPATASFLSTPATSLASGAATNAFLTAPAAASSGAAGGGATAGLLGTMNKYKPFMDAAQTGMNMFQQPDGPAQAPAQPPLQYGNPGPKVLNEIANAGQSQAQGILAAADQGRKQRRMMRRGIL